MSGVGQAVFMNQRSFEPPPVGLFSWGDNAAGGLGLNDTVYRSSPAQVGALTTWAQVAGGALYGGSGFAIAVKSNGTLWGWGGNSNGAAGLNDTVSRSSPVQIGASSDWSKVGTGTQQSFAIKTNNSLWAWGRNSTFGQLGLGNIINRSSPVQVGALTNWAQISSGSAATFSVKTDGTLWAWGRGNYITTGITRSSPVQIGSLTNWKQVSAGTFHCGAVKTDGTLWMWGKNGNGQLGLNNTTDVNSPVQVGALTAWSQVSAGLSFTTAVKTDGTIWSWGVGGIGQLGHGDSTNRSSPVQVGALTNWSQVSASENACVAIKTDGTMWSWGFNNAGQLGLGNTVALSSPTQVGLATSWTTLGSFQRSRSFLAIAE